MLIYVDDIILTDNNSDFIQKLVTNLSAEFFLKNLYALHYFLGIEVKNVPNGFHITQSKYTKDILQKSKIMDVPPISTPMATSMNKCSKENELLDSHNYRSLVGCL